MKNCFLFIGTIKLLLLITARWNAAAIIDQRLESQPIIPLQFQLTFPNILLFLLLLLGQALGLKVHETVDWLIITPRGLPLGKLALGNYTYTLCRSVRQNNFLIRHLNSIYI